MLLPVGLGIALTIISIIGLCLNVFIIIIIVLTKQITSNNILLTHLSVTQSLLSLVFLTFSFPPIIHDGIWIASIEFPCKMDGFLLITLHPLTLWTVCGLNCDRFYAISAPLHYSVVVTNKKVILGLISGWVIILFLSIPTFTEVAPYKFSSSMFACVPDFSTKNSLWYASIFTFATLIIPGIVIITCNIKVLMIARHHRHRIAAAIYEVALSAQVAITHQRNPFFIPTVTAPSSGGPTFRSRSPISTVLQFIISFILIYLPYYISIISNSLVAFLYNKKSIDGNDDVDNVPKVLTKTNQFIVLVSQCSLTSSTIINALLYGLKNKTVRTTFQNYWRKKRTKNEIQQEIQARTPSTCGSRRPSVSNSGFFIHPLMQRRLSETFVDVDQNVIKPTEKIRRISSDLTWGKISSTISDLKSSINTVKDFKSAGSCNTLQVPTDDAVFISYADKEACDRIETLFSSMEPTDNKTTMDVQSCNRSNGSTKTSILCGPSKDNFCYAQRSTTFFQRSNTSCNRQDRRYSLEPASANYLKKLRISIHNKKRFDLNNLSDVNYKFDKKKHHATRKTPKILITSALSEESDIKSASFRDTRFSKFALRKYSSTCHLQHSGDSNFDSKFELAKLNKPNSETDKICEKDMEPIAKDKYEFGALGSCMCNNFPVTSELCQRKYSSMEETVSLSKDNDDCSIIEEQLLLSWPTTRKKLKLYSGTTFSKKSICKISNWLLRSTDDTENKNKKCSGNDVNIENTYRPGHLFGDPSERYEVIL